jgi:DNA-binding MarR family transcriptional regulator
MENKELVAKQFEKVLFGMKVQMDEIKSQLGIEMPEMHCRVLAVLHECGDCLQSKIINSVGRDKSQIARVLTKLQKSGYIYRMANKSDGRSQLVCLTDEGKEYMKTIMVFYDEASCRMLAGLDQKELTELTKTLSKVIDNLYSGSSFNRENLD